MNETPATVRMIDGATAPAISNVFVNNACAVCTLQITGSFAAATVLVEGIVNVASNQWVTLAAFNLSDLSLEKNGADNAGIYQVGIEGILRVRMNVTEISGGDITIAAQFGNATINQFSETEASNLIPITAYDLAVAGGYTGTLDQFETDMGNSGTNAANAAASASAAAASAESVSASTAQIATNTNDISDLKTQLNQRGIPTGGSTGQSLRKRSGTNYDMEWADVGLPTDEQTADAVSAWLDEHPEATTTVEDHSITEDKLSNPLINKINSVITVDQYSDLVSGDDWTTALQTAINENETVLVNHDITIRGTVSIPRRKTIWLQAVTVKKPADAGNTTPIFYLGQQYGALIGSGNGSVVQSLVASPDGIIKVGSESNTTATTTVTFCTVSDLFVTGKENADDNIGVHLCGTAVSSNISYFHHISNLVIDHVAMGIVFNNGANANIVNNIYFMYCGYNKTTGALCFIRTKSEEFDINNVPIENIITNAFHHQSKNAATVYVGSYIGYTRIDNVACEQGGASARAVYVNSNESHWADSSRNIIKITTNTAYGVDANADFLAHNTIETKTYYRAKDIIADSLTLNGKTIHDTGKTVYNLQSKSDVSLSPQTAYEIGSFTKHDTLTHINRCALVRIIGVTSFVAGNANASVYTDKTYSLQYDANSYTIDLIGTGVGTLDLSIDSSGKLQMTTPNYTQSAYTKLRAMINVEIYGYTPDPPFTLTNSDFERTN